MPKRDLSFELIRLFSQRIVSNDKIYPEGEVLRKTSCMNPEDAEIVGVLEAVKPFFNSKEDEEPLKIINDTQGLIEKISLSRWFKSELTHLGFRAGLKYEESEDLGKEQAIDEVDVMSEQNAE